MAASSLSKNASSPTGVKSTTALSHLEMHTNDVSNDREYQKTKSTPFDDLIGQDEANNEPHGRISDLSEMDYLAKTNLSNNLMTAAVK